MMVVRPIEKRDLQAFEQLAYSATIGITSLPKDPELLQAKIDSSLLAFSPLHKKPHHHLYLFVLEELQSGRLLGTSAIRAQASDLEPSYYYRIEEIKKSSLLAENLASYRALRPVKYQNGPSELCGLFLLEEFRSSHLGRLLSFSRFLMIANRRSRFKKSLIAEMRGVIDEKGESPFWNALGRRFYSVPLEKALELPVYHRELLKEILPEYPILVPLLSKEAQEALGKTHEKTAPALRLLLEQGFHLTDEIDLFDGGPKISAQVGSIRAVAESRSERVKTLEKELSEQPLFLAASTSLNFRAAAVPLAFETKGGLALERDAAEALEVKRGDRLRFWRL